MGEEEEEKKYTFASLQRLSVRHLMARRIENLRVTQGKTIAKVTFVAGNRGRRRRGRESGIKEPKSNWTQEKKKTPPINICRIKRRIVS